MYVKRLFLLLALTVSLGVIASAEDAPAQGRYAAMLFADSAGQVSSADSDNVRYVQYLLEDPMVGDFTLTQLDLTGAKDGSDLETFSRSVEASSENASMAFLYLTGPLDKAFESAGVLPEDYFSSLPGRTKIVVWDRTIRGEPGEKPVLSISVVPEAADCSLVKLAYTGAAGADNSAAASLLAALRGNADADKDRVITIAELAAFLSAAAVVDAPADLGSVGSTPLVKYRSPAEVASAVGPDAALLLASRYNGQQRWVESLLVLREIRDAKIAEPLYREISETAQLNLGIESRYGAERDENVRRDVNSGLELVSDIVLFANLHYVTDVDNRTLFAGGIRNLQLLLDNRRVSKELIPADRRSFAPEFASFLKETLAHVYEKSSLPEGDFIMRVKRIMMESDATVKLPPGAIVSEFLYGVPASLDPNTDYIPRRAYKDFQDDTVGHFGGIGIEITLEDKILTVITPLDGTPAAEAGILPGDRIVAIEGVSTDGIELTDAVGKLRGPIGSKVTMSVVHRGATTPVDVTMARGTITIESIKGFAVDPATGQWNYMIDADSKIAYVRMTDFKEDTPDDLDRALSEASAKGLRGLILDLRFNRGGLLNSGVKVCDRFLSEGTIVSVKGAHIRPSTFRAHYFKTFDNVPMIVLVNEQSASAAEILAGALQDYHRATLVGARSFGKGTVQTIYELERGQSALKLTTAKYYTPSGASIHREPWSDKGGLTPDVAVPMTGEENSRLLEVWHLRGLRSDARQRLVEMGKLVAEKNPDYKVPDADSFSDPQLEKGINILRTALGVPAMPSLAGSARDLPAPAGVETR